jgi:hypothetical protein
VDGMCDYCYLAAVSMLKLDLQPVRSWSNIYITNTQCGEEEVNFNSVN